MEVRVDRLLEFLDQESGGTLYGQIDEDAEIREVRLRGLETIFQVE